MGWDPPGSAGLGGLGEEGSEGTRLEVWKKERGKKWKGERKGEERKREVCWLLALNIDLSQAVLGLCGQHQVLQQQSLRCHRWVSE